MKLGWPARISVRDCLHVRALRRDRITRVFSSLQARAEEGMKGRVPQELVPKVSGIPSNE